MDLDWEKGCLSQLWSTIGVGYLIFRFWIIFEEVTWLLDEKNEMFLTRTLTCGGHEMVQAFARKQPTGEVKQRRIKINLRQFLILCNPNSFSIFNK